VSEKPDIHEIASAVHISVGLFIFRLRQAETDGDLSWPQMAALARLDRIGSSTPGDLAKMERISPQGMGLTLAVLEERGLIQRKPDPNDGRRILMSVTKLGRSELHLRRNERTDRLAEALAEDFTAAELKRLEAAAPLIARLADAVDHP
jgi:DNA-binding MarR family transcriptional regulator